MNDRDSKLRRVFARALLKAGLPPSSSLFRLILHHRADSVTKMIAAQQRVRDDDEMDLVTFDRHADQKKEK